MWATQQRKWSGQDVSGCLGGHLRSDEELTRGPAKMMPRGQTSGSTCGWTHGINPPPPPQPTMVKATTICTVLSFAISHNWPIRQLDVHNAFLNGLLVEDVYIAQPSDFVLSQFPNYFCKLEKTLYGLKQAPRAWFQHLQDTLLKWGFQPFIVDPSMFLF